MDRLFYFFDMDYEEVPKAPDLPFRLMLVSVAYVGPHWHPETEVLFLLKGSVRVGNSRGTFRLGEGDVMIVNANELHDLVDVTENVILVLQFDPRDVRTKVGREDTCFPLPPESPLDEGILVDVRRSLARLAEERWTGGSAYVPACLSGFYGVLAHIERGVPAREPVEPTRRVAKTQERIKSVLDHLHRRYSEKITLGDVADLMGVTPNYASYLIRRGTGRTFQDNLSFIRTGHAVRLLMSTDRSLLDIALSVGFSDPKYFSRSFRRLYGVSPRQMMRKPDWRDAILNPFRNEGLDPTVGRALIEGYC